MKNLLLTTIALISLSTAALALDTSIVGYGEYAVEAEALESSVGIELAMGAVTVTPSIEVIYTSNTDFEFNGAEVSLIYGLTETLNVYGVVEANKDFEHQETTLGIAFRF